VEKADGEARLQLQLLQLVRPRVDPEALDGHFLVAPFADKNFGIRALNRRFYVNHFRPKKFFGQILKVCEYLKYFIQKLQAQKFTDYLKRNSWIRLN
jgi:hypothetical protein